MSENKTIEQAKQELLNRMVDGNTNYTADELALAYKHLCEAQESEFNITYREDLIKAYEFENAKQMKAMAGQEAQTEG